MKTTTIKLKVSENEEEFKELKKAVGDKFIEECADKIVEIIHSYKDPAKFAKDLECDLGMLNLLIEKLSEEGKLSIVTYPYVFAKYDEIEKLARAKALKHLIKTFVGGLLDD